MGAWLESLVPWGYQWITWMQTWHHPWLTLFFKAITILGNEVGYLGLLPLMFWCVRGDWGRRLGIVVFTSVFLNFLIKGMFGIPRPDASVVMVLVKEVSPSFPSGHAQGMLVLWGYLAWRFHRTAGYLVAGLLVFLIGLSRVYLGAHFPQDILGGWVVGAALLLLFIGWEPHVTERLKSWSSQALVTLAGAVSVGMLSVLWIPGLLATTHAVEESKKGLFAVSGAIFGFAVGMIYERRYLGFSTDGSAKDKLFRYFIGAVPVGLLYIGLKKIFPEGGTFRWLRYALVGGAASWLAPWLFVRLKLASVRASAAIEKPEATAVDGA